MLAPFCACSKRLVALLHFALAKKSNKFCTCPKSTLYFSGLFITVEIIAIYLKCCFLGIHELILFVRDSGALGSRLSGAGWGGCTGSLVPAEKLDSFLDSVKKGYYIGRPYREERLAESLFATEPGSGAAIFQINA